MASTQIEWLDIDDIKPYPKNPRKNHKTIQPLMDSIERYGFNQPIVIDKNNVIVVGHTRFQAAKNLEMTQVPVVKMLNQNDDKIKAYRIMDNKAHDYSKFNVEELRDELFEIDNIDGTALTLKEIDNIMYPELGLIGKEIKNHKVKHRVIIECESKDQLRETELKMIEEGFICRTRYY
jgi:ParB-like chromosome segregation protein Spo0J